MNYSGKVRNGVVVLPPEVSLPEGTEVDVTPRQSPPEDPPHIKAMLQLAKARPHWPKDYALNHAHYLKGHPLKS